MIVARSDCASPHTGMASECCFDLAQLNAETANLDLTISATDKFDVAVGQIPDQIAGAIQSVPGWSERIGNESFRRHFVAAEVAAREPRATDAKFSYHADRHGLHASVQDVHRGCRDRLSDRD